MIDALLRRPSTTADLASDGVRILGVLSLLAGLLWYGPVEAALFALVLLGLLVSRCLQAAPLFSMLYGFTLLAAAWSSVLDLYARIGWWDLAVHFAATGALSAMTWYLLAALGAVTAPAATGHWAGLAVAAVVTALGLALSVLWELAEWWGHTFVDAGINVGYQDTLGDLAAGGLGALAAGYLLQRRARGSGPASAARVPLQDRFKA